MANKKSILVTVDEELANQLDDVAKRRGASRSTVIREAIELYVLAQNQGSRSPDALIAECLVKLRMAQDELKKSRSIAPPPWVK